MSTLLMPQHFAMRFLMPAFVILNATACSVFTPSSIGSAGVVTTPIAVVVMPKTPSRRPSVEDAPAVVQGGTMALSEKEILDTIKAASTEVDCSLPEAQRVLMSRAVADTIWNRKQSGLFGATVTEVVNQPWQFSAISSNLPNAYGTIDAMPDSAIKPLVRKDVEAWLILRSNGMPAQVDGLNFLNPNFSSDQSLRSWGSAVIQQAQATGQVYGKGRSVHFHGTAPSLMEKRPKPFRIILPKGWSPR